MSKYEWQDFFLIVGICTLLFGLICGSKHLVHRYTCASRAEVMGMRSKYGFMIGCMIETKSGWIGIDKYRVIE